MAIHPLLVEYFSLKQSGGMIDPQTYIPTPTAKLLAWLKTTAILCCVLKLLISTSKNYSLEVQY